MLRSRNLVFVSLLFCLLLALPALGAVGSKAAEPCDPEPVQGPCGEEERQQFLQAAEEGVPMEELYQMYSHCLDGTDGLQAENTKIIANTFNANRWYEQMNGCGYHPQARVAACDVELKRQFGYGWYPNGSTEHVTFCFLCGGGWIQVPGSVHVTNDISGTVPSYGFMAFANAPAACPSTGSGASFQVRATLSWAAPAWNACSTFPWMIWGNQITFDTRDDP